MNCVLKPFATLGLAGVTAIDTSVAGVTVKVVEPKAAPLAAEIVADPVPTATVSPLEPAALLTDATVVSDELQATTVVKFCVELSV